VADLCQQLRRNNVLKTPQAAPVVGNMPLLAQITQGPKRQDVPRMLPFFALSPPYHHRPEIIQDKILHPSRAMARGTSSSMQPFH